MAAPSEGVVHSKTLYKRFCGSKLVIDKSIRKAMSHRKADKKEVWVASRNSKTKDKD